MPLLIDIKSGDTTVTSLTGRSKIYLNTKEKYIDDYITIDAVHDTEDATALATDIKPGTTAYTASGKVNGAMPVYNWTSSDHSITRIGVEENDGEPLYNWDLCQVGATAAAINAIKFCKKKNPFNGGITRFAVELMISQYFTYVKCLSKKPLFAELNLWNAKRFYNLCYKDIENNIDDEVLTTMYTAQYAGQSEDMIGIIPEITFFDFMKKIKTDEYRGKEEFDEIRAKMPDWVIELDKKSGVLGEEGYIYCTDEEKLESKK